MVRALPLWVLPLAWLVAFNTNLPVVLQAPIHLLTFFFAAMVCHGVLAQRRPDGRYLTEFYLCMSVGGVLGGVFNALVAPLMFTTVLEYPLALVLACALRPGVAGSEPPLRRRLDFALPLIVGGFALAMMFLLNASQSKAPLTLVLAFIVPTVICFSFSRRPLRFALSVGALMLAAGTYAAAQERVTHRGRSFFGVHRVYDMPEKNLRYLVHGGIIHGVQHLDAARRREPEMYYHKDGPMGQVFSALKGRSDITNIGVVGLGIGSLAAYSEAGQQWTFFEIDPEIADLARDSRHFTFLSDSPARMRIVLGDARIALTKEPAAAFDMLIVDAFSSDAIPVHLLTREALRLYWQKIDSRGVLAFHISNRYLDLGPLVCALARDAGLVCLVRLDKETDWAVMARSADVLGVVAHDPRWRAVPATAGSLTWTDDFSNPLSLVRWFGK
jgi:spermidine synthase